MDVRPQSKTIRSYGANMSQGAHTRYDLTRLLDEIEHEQGEQLRYVRLNARHEPIPTRLYVLAFAVMLTVIICAVLP